MIHPDLWLTFVQQRQRELSAEAEQSAMVQRLKPRLFKRLLRRLTDNSATLNAHGDNEQTCHTPGGPRTDRGAEAGCLKTHWTRRERAQSRDRIPAATRTLMDEATEAL